MIVLPRKRRQDWVRGTALALSAAASVAPVIPQVWANPVVKKVQRQGFVAGTPATLIAAANLVTFPHGEQLTAPPVLRERTAQGWTQVRQIEPPAVPLPTGATLLSQPAARPAPNSSFVSFTFPGLLDIEYVVREVLVGQRFAIRRGRQDFIAGMPLALGDSPAVENPVASQYSPQPRRARLSRQDWVRGSYSPLFNPVVETLPIRVFLDSQVRRLLPRQDWNPGASLGIRTYVHTPLAGSVLNWDNGRRLGPRQFQAAPAWMPLLQTPNPYPDGRQIQWTPPRTPKYRQADSPGSALNTVLQTINIKPPASFDWSMPGYTLTRQFYCPGSAWVLIRPTPVPPPTPTTPVVGRPGRWPLMAKVAAETRRESWDFISMISRYDTVASAEFFVALYSGNTDDSATILQGSPSVRRQRVLQRIGGGTQGQVYQIVCTVETVAGVEASLVSFLAVV